jgi:hypothetical protein
MGCEPGTEEEQPIAQAVSRRRGEPLSTMAARGERREEGRIGPWPACLRCGRSQLLADSGSDTRATPCSLGKAREAGRWAMGRDDRRAHLSV